MLCVFWLIVYNSFVNLIMVLVEMWRESDYKFVKQSSYAIDVCPSIMPLAE
jgi:hypothetical protein